MRRPPRSQHLDIVALAHSPARATAPAGVAGPNLSDLPPPPPGSAAFLAPPPYLPPPPELLSGRHGAGGRARFAGKKLPVVMAGMSALALGCFGALRLVSGGESKGPSYPETWDGRLTELVAFVEQERGLSFEHPIFVDFLPARDIARAARRADGAPSGEQLEVALLEAARLRALGLHTGEADLRAGDTPLAAEDAVPYYDPSTQRMVVPDQPLDASGRIILVHELTHALQDQHFELLATEAKSTAPDTYRALAEGDAMRIDQRYQAKLSLEDQALLSGEAQGRGGHRRSSVAASSSLEALRLAPFVLGPTMVDTLFDLDGQGGIDATFRHPPVSDEALLDPSYYRGHGTVRVVPPPPVVAGELVEDEGTLGPMIWYLMLARSGDHAGALKAAFGWGGDRYVVVANGESSCLRVAYRGDSSEDVAEMKAALEGWVASVPGARRELTSAGDQLVLTACDPGPEAALPPGINPTDTLLAPQLVMELAVRLQNQAELTYSQARCVAVAVVAQYPLADLATFASLGPDAVLTPAQDGDLAARTQVALALCP